MEGAVEGMRSEGTGRGCMWARMPSWCELAVRSMEGIAENIIKCSWFASSEDLDRDS